LIDVFRDVHKHKPNAKLLLLGDGPLQDKIRQKVEAIGISESVIFAGLQKDSAPFYSAMDIFTFPSLWEGLPLTLVEAQYNGLTCMVSENVTEEVGISPQLMYIPLTDKMWTRHLVMCNCRVKREYKILSEKYNINYATDNLRRLYE